MATMTMAVAAKKTTLTPIKIRSYIADFLSQDRPRGLIKKPVPQ
jgi:hypothetical protein